MVEENEEQEITIVPSPRPPAAAVDQVMKYAVGPGGGTLAGDRRVLALELLAVRDELAIADSQNEELIAQLRESSKRVETLLGAIDVLKGELAKRRCRQPSDSEMEAALGDSQIQQTTFEGWTVRRCRHCAKPIAGGAGACGPCIHNLERATLLREKAGLVAELNKLRAQVVSLASPTQLVVERGVVELSEVTGVVHKIGSK